MEKKKLLYEVSYIRPIVIFLLVVSHSFTKIHKGAGDVTQDYDLAIGYLWLVRLIKGFRIETIALVAGYVFAYQSIDLGKKYEFWPFVKKKFVRLIIPMLFFGCIYYFFFFFKPASFSIFDFVNKLLSGCGHLWFLPMLFWCFIAIWLIDHYHLSSKWLLLILAVFSIAPPLNLPFGLNRLPHFLFFVYAGYFLWEHHDVVMSRANGKWIVLAWVAYVLLVVVKSTLVPSYKVADTALSKVLLFGLNNVMHLITSCCGIMALYLTVVHFTSREGFTPPQWVINASNDCYGVYVFHQFILVWLYFYTPLVAVCPSLLVPLVGFVVAFSSSLLLTKLTLKTRFGRFLIG